MHSFFYSWRRKAGVVALLMACGLMGLWARSFVIEDEFWFAENHGSGPQFALVVVSHTGISWWSWRSQVRNPSHSSDWRSFPVNSKNQFDIFKSHKRSISHLRSRVELREYHFPLWPIAVLVILPPTLLSCYLVLGKPRKRAAS